MAAILNGCTKNTNVWDGKKIPQQNTGEFETMYIINARNENPITMTREEVPQELRLSLTSIAFPHNYCSYTYK